MIKVSELRFREVINVLDGKKYGFIKDIDLDVEAGRINALLVPGHTKFARFFSRRDDIVVPWDRIVKIGRDVILVEITSYSEPRHLRD